MRGINRVFVPGIALIFSIVAAAGSVNAFAGQTTRVSVSTAGAAANGSVSAGVLSADGRYVVFQSTASNLVTGVTGLHVYRHDRTTGVTELVDLAAGSVNASAGPAFQPSVSADGRYVVFASPASDLVSGDANLVQDIFRRDMQLGTTAMVSANLAGDPGDQLSGLNGLAGAHEISDDGRYVVFLSNATNLVAGANGKLHVYVKDMTTGDVVRASVSNAVPAEPANANSTTPVISGDGHVVAFGSAATNLGASTTSQVWVRDLVAGITSLETPGAAAVGMASTVPSLSFDGRYLAFVTQAHLEPADADNGNPDVFLRDRVADTTVLASRSPNLFSGVPTGAPSISADGRWVAYDSLDDMLVTADLGGLTDVFVYDRDTHAIALVSRNDADEQATGTINVTASTSPSISRDGGAVLFVSNAANLANPAMTTAQLYVRILTSNQAPVLPAFGKDYVLSESQAMHLTWEFSDNDSTSWLATVDYGVGAGVQPLVLGANKTFLLEHLWAPGAYNVTVEVTDDAGAKGSLVIHVVVSNVAPSVALPSTMDLAFTRTLDASGTFTDPGSNETYSATVSYGDGTPAQSLAIGPYSAPPLAAGSFKLQHTYATAGSYTVAVTVTDSNGGSTSANMQVNVGGYSYEWFSSFAVGRVLPVKFTVRGPDGAFVLDQSVRVDVIDAAGSVVAGPYLYGDQPSRSVMASGDSYHVNVDTRALAPGEYRLRVQFSSPTLTGEFTLSTAGSATSAGKPGH